MKKPRARQSNIMRHFSTLAGPIQKLPRGEYRVSFIRLLSKDRFIYRHWTRVVAYGVLLLNLSLAFIVLKPEHWIAKLQPDSDIHIQNIVMLFSLISLQAFLLIGIYSATRSTVKARNPVPVRPPKGLRVAFATTRAPGEPVDMVRVTLTAMKSARYKNGNVDVWLLDETKDRALKKICKELGVKYFTRNGIAKWNTPKYDPARLRRLWSYVLWLLTFGLIPFLHKVKKPNAFLAARTKHGNFNAWREYLVKKKITYDILTGVDTDQVPERNYLERLLGYFRDEDVAFVVGPQVYGNYRPGLAGVVARWAESQASFFQSTIQRAGNASNSSMFVGTNYAVRTNVLDQIGGFQPCITEDMATGLAIHTQRNPATGKHWKSVYTPDVLAVGEGPDLWGPYFTQQWRWAAGTFDTWRRVVWRVFYKLSPKSMLHYFLMLTFYPINALTWLFGIVSTLVYLTTGATAVLAPWNEFLSLYLMSIIMQLSLYFWNRRFNVSPHEPQGSYGLSGMMLTSLASPIYFSALIGVLLGKKAHFVVTTKGGAENNLESIRTFKVHLTWALIIFSGLLYGLTHGHNHPAMLIWAFVQLIICLSAPAIGWAAWLPVRIQKAMQAKKLVHIGESTNA